LRNILGNICQFGTGYLLGGRYLGCLLWSDHPLAQTIGAGDNLWLAIYTPDGNTGYRRRLPLFYSGYTKG